MKRIVAFLCMLTVLLSFASCDNLTNGEKNENSTGQQSEHDQSFESETESNHGQTSQVDQSTENDTSEQLENKSETPITGEGENMLKIEIIVGSKTFSATLYDNESAKSFSDMLPLTLKMSELNGNEKYYYLDSKLPTDASRPSGIKTGDIMLYGNSCIVLFYESFSTSYSYTPIGHIDDPSGLAEALGSGSVEVTFAK